jgi:formylglycine-generating enzyme required for sulfatase activity
MSGYILVFHFLSLILSPESDPFESYQQQVPDTDLTIPMTPVAGGKFLMGHSDENGELDEKPVHEVQVDDFWMGTYEITWDQYDAFVYRNDADEPVVLQELGIDGVSSATAPYIEMSKGMGKAGYPAMGMTQYAALSFCKWLSARTGIFYRLPTEAEWEYACRAGSDVEYPYDNAADKISDYIVYEENSNYAYAKTGSKKPNRFGLYDMSGNVSEWTMDQYDAEFYSGSALINPWNRPETLYPRVVRGGSYKDPADECRCTARGFSQASWKRIDPQIPKSRWWHTNAFFVGFRVVRPKNPPSPEEIKKYWLEPIDDYGG